MKRLASLGLIAVASASLLLAGGYVLYRAGYLRSSRPGAPQRLAPQSAAAATRPVSEAALAGKWSLSPGGPNPYSAPLVLTSDPNFTPFPTPFPRPAPAGQPYMGPPRWLTPWDPQGVPRNSPPGLGFAVVRQPFPGPLPSFPPERAAVLSIPPLSPAVPASRPAAMQPASLPADQPLTRPSGAGDDPIVNE